MVIGKSFDKSKLNTLIEVYHKIFEEDNRNIFNFSDFLRDSGITSWNKEYIEFLFYYFNDKPLFSGINLVLYDSTTLYAINFLEPFALNLFNELNGLEFKFRKGEDFFQALPSFEKVGYIEFTLMFYLEYFKKKYSSEKKSEMILAEFSPEYFKPKSETKEKKVENLDAFRAGIRHNDTRRWHIEDDGRSNLDIMRNLIRTTYDPHTGRYPSSYYIRGDDMFDGGRDNEGIDMDF